MTTFRTIGEQMSPGAGCMKPSLGVKCAQRKASGPPAGPGEFPLGWGHMIAGARPMTVVGGRVRGTCTLPSTTACAAIRLNCSLGTAERCPEMASKIRRHSSHPRPAHG